jgi:hypothetical protein
MSPLAGSALNPLKRDGLTPCHITRWTTTWGPLHQSTIRLGTMFFTHHSQSNNAESASQALFDLKLQPTPLLRNPQCSILSRVPPPIGLYCSGQPLRDRPLYVYKELTFQRTQTLLLPHLIIGNSNSLPKGAADTQTSKWPTPRPPASHFFTTIPPTPGQRHHSHFRLL